MVGTLSMAENKVHYDQKLCGLLEEYSKILIDGVDDVRLNKHQIIRHGNNTMMKRSIKIDAHKTNDDDPLNLPFFVGHDGLIFTRGDMKDVQEEIAKQKDPSKSSAASVLVAEASVPAKQEEKKEEPAEVDLFDSLVCYDKLMAKGYQAFRENNYCEAIECFGPALKIRVGQHGEYDIQCLEAYFNYGYSLLYKASEEAGHLDPVPKKEGGPEQVCDKDAALKDAVNDRSLTGFVSSNTEQDADGNEFEIDIETAVLKVTTNVDLNLASQMLTIAKNIAEKIPAATIEKGNILTALWELAFEQVDCKTSIAYFKEALSILEQLEEADSQRIVKIYSMLCHCLYVPSKPEEAILYCEKAIAFCKSRVEFLASQGKGSLSGPASSSTAPELDQGVGQSFSVSEMDKGEIETLTCRMDELERKLKNLQQAVSRRESFRSKALAMARDDELFTDDEEQA